MLASSSTYDTDPVGEVLDQPDFLNACVRIETELDARGAARRLQGASRRSSGARPRGRATRPRPIDVDMLLLGDIEHHSDAADAPARATAARRFVLIPLLELDFDARDARR